MVNSLEKIPLEIFDSIFSYLNLFEIFQSFTNLNKNLDEILKSYSKYKLKLKNISKKDFHFICNYFQPSLIILLELSNDLMTPGLIDLFFNYFHLKEFIQLKYLYLYSIDLNQFSKIIFENLCQLKQLEIFILDQSYFSQDIDLIDSFQFDSPLKYFSLTFENNLPYGNNLFDFTSPNLNHLQYLNCQFDENINLSKLCLQMPSLHTLNARISAFPSTENLTPIISPKLKRLQLNFNNGLLGILTSGNLTLNDIKMLLSLLLNQLKELTIISLNSDIDLVDGDGWKEFLCSFKQLNRFEFRFTFAFEGQLNVKSKKVESFKSNYWSMDRKCFITINENSIYTVPYFSPLTVKYLEFNSPSDYIWTNSPSQDLLNENTTNIQFDIETLQKEQKEKQIFYKNIENIDWQNKENHCETSNHLSLIRTTFDLAKIICFKGFPSTNSTIFMNYIQILPRLEEIHFNFTSKLFRKIRVLPQIRRIRIYFDEETEENTFTKELDDFCRVFSNVEQLILMKRIENEFIFYLIERLTNLSSCGILCSLDDEITIDIEQRFISLTTIHSNNSQKKMIALWIDHSQQHSIKQSKRKKIKSKNKCILI